MTKLTRDNLINNFIKATESEALFVGVKIHMAEFKKDEVIINESDNFQSKLTYYLNTYDEELNHKFAKGVIISGFTYGYSFDDIQADLVD